MTNYADNLRFFTDVVTHLENRSERSPQLVEERSHDLLARAFTSDDDGVIIAVDEGDMMNGGEDGANNGDGEASGDDSGASDASGDAKGDVMSYMSD